MKHKATTIILAGMLLTLLLASPATPLEQTGQQVKAAMLYNAAKFVEWSGPSRPDTSLVICVLGRPAIAPALEALVGKSVQGHLVRVQHATSLDNMGACQVLYIGEGERRNLPAILASAGRRGILTVSDMDRFAALGGILGMVENEGKVKLEVNLDAAQQANLKISSQLLKLARIVRGDN
jgi:hypothetical protein